MNPKEKQKEIVTKKPLNLFLRNGDIKRRDRIGGK